MGHCKEQRMVAEAAKQRCYAEERLHSDRDGVRPGRTEVELQRLVHELEVYKIELEMQNAELRQAEESIRKLNLLYMTLSGTSNAIASIADRDELFQAICRIAVELGGFRMVWIGLLDAESGVINPAASFGVGTDYLDTVRISTRRVAEGMGPTGTVSRSGGYYICNDFMSDPRMAPWQSEAVKRGFLATAALAIRMNGAIVGAITMYAAEKEYFDPQMVELLVQMQGDISFALDNLDRENRRRKAEQDLKEEITGRMLAVEALREKEQMLLQQSRLAAMGEMINNISHQWRQPLNALGLVVQKLPIFYDSAEFNREFLEKNTDAAMKLIRQMSRTIEDFRDFFRYDKEMKIFSVNGVIEQTISLIELSFRDQQIRIVYHTEGDPMLEGYPNEFSQVLLNILMNAHDALVGQNIAGPLISVHAFVEGDTSVVTITDNAGGIADEIIDRIFDPYFTTKGPDKGTGIGLFMSKTIIDKNMGGRLSVCNTGNGAEFRIEVKNGRKQTDL